MRPILPYKRDALGNVLDVHDALGQAEHYTYAPSGRIATKTDKDGQRTDYEYDVLARLTKVSYPDGRTVRYTYDALNTLTSVQDWTGTTHIHNDSLGRPLKVTYPDGSELACGYDELSRRSFLVYPDGTELRYLYDAAGRLIEKYDGAGTWHYRYDRRGNMTEVLLNDELQCRYSFNAQGLLEELVTGEGRTTSFAYNALGQRISKCVDGVTTSYACDITRPFANLLQAREGDTVHSYLWDTGIVGIFGDDPGNSAGASGTGVEGAGGRAAGGGSGGAYYLTTDTLGSPLGLSDEAGMPLESYQFDEFGHSATPPSAYHPFGFTGHLADGPDGLLYAQARYYAPQLGRFLSVDTHKGRTDNPQTFNEYAYCRNQPLDLVDWDGKEPMNPIEVWEVFWKGVVVGDNWDNNRVIENGGTTANYYAHTGGEIFVVNRDRDRKPKGITISIPQIKIPFFNDTANPQGESSTTQTPQIDPPIKDFSVGFSLNINFSPDGLLGISDIYNTLNYTLGTETARIGSGVNADGVAAYAELEIRDNLYGGIYNAVKTSARAPIADWQTVGAVGGIVVATVLIIILALDNVTGFGVADDIFFAPLGALWMRSATVLESAAPNILRVFGGLRFSPLPACNILP